MHSHAERGNDQATASPDLFVGAGLLANASVQSMQSSFKIDGAATGLFPAKAGPTKKHRTHTVGPASAGKFLICF